jgi:hypothetical protein
MYPKTILQSHRTAGRAQGQATVEFALMLPLFIVLLIGFFGVATMVFSYLTVNNAARDGIHYVITYPDTKDLGLRDQLCRLDGIGLGGSQEACLAKYTAGELLIHGSCYNPITDQTTCQAFDKPDVTVTYRVPVPTLRVTFLNGSTFTILGPITVTATSTMIIE